MPAEGAVLQPLPEQLSDAGYALLLGYEVGSDPRSVRHAVTVRYRVGEEERTVTYPYLLAICTSGRTQDCEPPLS